MKNSLATEKSIGKLLFSPWKWLLGVALLSGLVTFVDAKIGWSAILSYWAAIPAKTLITAFVFFLISHLLRALRIQLLLELNVTQSVVALFKLSAIHQFFNNLLPMRLGEAVFPILLRRYFSAGYLQGFANLFWLRLIDIAIIALVTLGCVYFDARISQFGGVLLLMGLAGLSLLYALRNIPFLSRFIIPVMTAAPSDPAKLFLLCFVSVVSWATKLAAMVIILLADPSASIFMALLGSLGGEVSSVLPLHGVAGAGSYEAGFVAASLWSGLGAENLLRMAVNVHFFVFFSTALIAVLMIPVPVRKVQDGFDYERSPVC